MTATTFIGHFLGPDTHANRPVVTGLPNGTHYVCTTHSKIERIVSGAWADYATLGTGPLTINSQTTDYTVALTDATAIVSMNKSTANTLTVPSNASVAFPVGTTIEIRQAGAGQTTVQPAAGVTLTALGSVYGLAGQYAHAKLTKIATDAWDLSGSITAGAPPVSPYATAALADNPLLYLRLEETSGASCANSGSLGGTATCNGTFTRNVASGTTNLGVGVQLEGVGDDDYISYPNTASLEIIGDVTYECWAKITTPSNNQYLMSKGGSAGVGGYGLGLLSNQIQVRIGGSGPAVNTSSAWPDSTNWHHVAFTRSGANYTIYLDGASVATATYSAVTPLSTAFAFQVGRNIYSGGVQFGLAGVIDEVAVYSTALSSARIAAHYAAR